MCQQYVTQYNALKSTLVLAVKSESTLQTMSAGQKRAAESIVSGTKPPKIPLIVHDNPTQPKTSATAVSH